MILFLGGNVFLLNSMRECVGTGAVSVTSFFLSLSDSVVDRSGHGQQPLVERGCVVHITHYSVSSFLSQKYMVHYKII